MDIQDYFELAYELVMLHQWPILSKIVFDLLLRLFFRVKHLSDTSVFRMILEDVTIFLF